MAKKQADMTPPVAPTPPEPEPEFRARPGRRTVEERRRAVLEVMAGKATVDQWAKRLGVQASTVEGWREDALAGVEESLRRGSSKTAREAELERENATLRQALTDSAITQH
jgi:transposase-like protein